MKIVNKEYKNLNYEDLFICVLGYEPRSYFLLEKNIETRNEKNTLVLKLDNNKHIQKMSVKLESKGIMLIDCVYDGTSKIMQQIHEFYKKNSQSNVKVSFHIDYSSMPRSWYCALPKLLSEDINENRELSFFYTAGDYPRKYNKYPTDGIDSISVFSGTTFPAVDIKRYHVMGLGYDKIRTETVKSIVEPDNLMTCYAYNPDNKNIKEKVYELNEKIINSSLYSLALPIDNFSGMVDRLCELVYDQLRDGQVIIIPDGPKPLIMAMSLIPDLIKRNGITCLHISRNSSSHSEIPVTPHENEIFGFQVL